MYAVIEAGGKQYRVAPGDVIQVDTLRGRCWRGNGIWPGARGYERFQRACHRRSAGEARVKGTISGHGRGDKVIVFKFKRKKQYKRTIGHRQNFTEVTVNEILWHRSCKYGA